MKLSLIGKTTRGRTYTRKSHCPKGHPYSGANLGVIHDVHRYCKDCTRANATRRYHSMTAAEYDRMLAVKREWYHKRGGKVKAKAFYLKTKEKYRARKREYGREYSKRPNAKATRLAYQRRTKDRRNELAGIRRRELAKDPAHRARKNAVHQAWMATPNGRAYYARMKEWVARWRKTPEGQLAVIRYSLRLPKDVPVTLLETYRLYQQLKKELSK